ncbi:hypothetical protein [Oscillibacter sp.]|uniref:hypothetical protein n=1 Tax=Oscillibacter sp. TaxID=1945593 RepID=UPI0028A04BEC|nr:hypothetical protein [Oscillibacter sp.]
MVDYGHLLPQKRKRQILIILAAESQARGIDASGIAYNSRGILHIYKSPYGYAPEDVDMPLKQGFSREDVEDFLYCGEC